MRGFILASAVGLLWLAAPALAAPCASGDIARNATGKNKCLMLRTYKGAAAAQDILVVYLHGDVSAGGPATYHFRVAEKAAALPALSGAVVVALVRPGYEDGAGNKSGGSHNGRRDHYTAENIDEVAGAIAKLNDAYKPKRTVLVGHSGGAATAALILGRHPGLADAAVLVSCPCNIGAWRLAGRGQPWPRSESPHRYADRVPAEARVVAITGSADDNTLPSLAEDYVRDLTKRGVAARFVSISGGHNGALESPAVAEAVAALAAGN